MLVCRDRTRHLAAAQERAVRHRAVALDLDVYLIRGGPWLGHGRGNVPRPCRRGRALLSHPAARGKFMNRSDGLLSPRGQALLFAALALLVFTAFPFAWMASTALKPSREIFAPPPTLWPAQVTLDNLARLFAETRFLTYFRNSVIVSSATVDLTLLVSVPAAYG